MKASDLAYLEMLKRRISNIDEDLNKLKKRQNSLLDLNAYITRRINGLEDEKGKLQSQIDNYSPDDVFTDGVSGISQRINDRYDSVEGKKNAYQQKITELNNLKKGSNSTYLNYKIDKRISRLNEKIEKLNKKETRIIGTQRRVIFPKFRKELLKQRLLSRATGAVNTYEDRMKSNEALRDSYADSGLFGKLAAKVYDIKARHYKSKMERAKDILSEMQSKDGIVAMRGARVTSLPKTRARKLAGRLGGAPTPTSTPAPVM